MEHMLVDILGQIGDLGVGVLPQLQNGDLLFRAIGLHQLLLQDLGFFQAEGQHQTSQIKGHRHLHAVDVGHHPVLIIAPLGEAGQVLIDPPVGGMEDMGAILVDEDAGVVQAVVGIAADMVPAFQHQHPLAAPFGQLPGGYRAGKARADDQAVEVLIHWDTPHILSCFVGIHN